MLNAAWSILALKQVVLVYIDLPFVRWDIPVVSKKWVGILSSLAVYCVTASTWQVSPALDIKIGADDGTSTITTWFSLPVLWSIQIDRQSLWRLLFLQKERPMPKLALISHFTFPCRISNLKWGIPILVGSLAEIETLRSIFYNLQALLFLWPSAAGGLSAVGAAVPHICLQNRWF